MYAVHRCHCFACRVAHANATAAYRAGRTWRENDHAPSVGVRRRLQALAAIGWSAADLAPHLGMTHHYVAKLRTDERHSLIRRSTYDAVVRVYDQLWNQPRRDTNGRRTASLSARYPLPLHWNDDEIDNPDARPFTKRNRPAVQPCGTASAQRRHYRRGEKPCAACMEAGLAAQRARRAAA